MAAPMVNQVSQEVFERITKRYEQWLAQITDMDKEPISVFDPLDPKTLDELELIREVSRELQQKKEEDIRKAAQAKEAQEEEKAPEESTDGNETEDVKSVEEEEKK